MGSFRPDVDDHCCQRQVCEAMDSWLRGFGVQTCPGSRWPRHLCTVVPSTGWWQSQTSPSGKVRQLAYLCSWLQYCFRMKWTNVNHYVCTLHTLCNYWTNEMWFLLYKKIKDWRNCIFYLCKLFKPYNFNILWDEWHWNVNWLHIVVVVRMGVSRCGWCPSLPAVDVSPLSWCLNLIQ